MPLTSKEFSVLEFFLQHPRQVIPRKDVEPLAGAFHGRPRADNYVAKLRSKLGLRKDELLITHRDVGYSLDTEVRSVLLSDRDDAGELYKTSLLHFNQHTVESMRTSVQHCLRVLEKQPRAPADVYVTLAYDYLNLGTARFSADLTDESMSRARAAALKALKIDPRSAGALGVLGLMNLVYDYDWGTAEKKFKHALSLDPSESGTLLSYAHLLISSGRVPEGLDTIEQAVKIDPVDKIVYASWGWLLLLAGRPELAEARQQEACFRFPDLPAAHDLMGLIYEAEGKYDEALESYGRALQLDAIPLTIASRGHLYALRGEPKLARSAIRDLSELVHRKKAAYVSGFNEALIRAGLGEFDKCLDALELAYGQKADWFIHLGVEPRWAPIRNHSRFKRLMNLVGIPPGH